MAGCVLGVRVGCCGLCACSILDLLLGCLFGRSLSGQAVYEGAGQGAALGTVFSMYNHISYKGLVNRLPPVVSLPPCMPACTVCCLLCCFKLQLQVAAQHQARCVCSAPGPDGTRVLTGRWHVPASFQPGLLTCLTVFGSSRGHQPQLSCSVVCVVEVIAQEP